MDNEYLNQHRHKDLGCAPIQVKGSGKRIQPRKLCANDCGKYIENDARAKYCVICKVDIQHQQQLVASRLRYRKKKLKNL